MVKILIVDDSEFFRETIKEILEDEGYAIAGEACDGAEGFDQYKKLRPDITTMDITMPVMDGIEALGKILEYDPDAKVIMASSSAQHSKVSEALILGAYAFLPKPFDREKLLAVISEIVNGIL
jgi:two-component system chemotaxis response regulator CheY